MSAPNLIIPSPNVFTGVSSTVSRVALLHHVRREDTVRIIWLKHILPQVMKEEFLNSVMTCDSFFKTFRLTDLDGDFHWLSQHDCVAAYQNLSQVTDKHVPARYVPWQLRFEFSPAILPQIMTTSFELHFEIGTLFEKSGWQYWRTDTGFSIMPLSLYDELKSLSTVYHAWVNLRDVKGAGFSDFKTEEEPIWKSSVARLSGALEDMPKLDAPGPNDLPAHFGGSNAAGGSLSAAGRTA
jgi:hypothetical protein